MNLFTCNVMQVVPLGYTALQGGLTRLAATGVPVYMISGGTHVHTGSHGEFYTRKVGAQGVAQRRGKEERQKERQKES